jgi:hypothetical protein
MANNGLSRLFPGYMPLEGKTSLQDAQEFIRNSHCHRPDMGPIIA